MAVREWKALSDQRVLEMKAENPFSDESPDEAWQWLPAMLGLPVEHDVDPLQSRPWATWIVGALLVMVALLTFGDLRHYISAFGFVPAEAFRLGGLTLLTSFFLHAGVLHLVGNGCFLLIFGDNVEDHLGSVRFVRLLVAATIAGHVLHAAFDPRSGIPCVGASGGISGVIAFYALQFPHARLGMMWRYYWRIGWQRFPAWAGLLVWLLFQSAVAYGQVLGASSVSALAHLGGAATGLAAWALWRKFERADLNDGESASTDEISSMFTRIRQS
ncbi:MAG: hypothetical protein CMJ64_03585 [Planctomycetaceae bacterium]|nr:hypothetical protein [Planctomycetaceae bacterium]